MAVNRTPQEHIETRTSLIDDTLLPSNHDANAVDLADTLNYMASQFADILGETNWYDAPDASIATIWAKTFLDEKFALRRVWSLTDVTVPASQNYMIMTAANIPNNNKAIGSTVLGLITAQHAGTFGSSHSLAEVAGNTAINPKNMLGVVDGATGDQILAADGRVIWALLQHESGATDDAAFTNTTPERAQISFVKVNSTNDDLIAVPVADIENKVVNLAYVERKVLDTFTEQDFLIEQSFVDLASAGATVTLDQAIDNQGATPATQATNISIRINDSVSWDFETSDGARNLLQIAPAVAGDEIEINVDTLDINVGASGIVDIDNGITVDSGGQSINLGTTTGQIDSTVLQVRATAGNLDLESSADVRFKTVRETTELPLDDATAGAISALPGGPHASISAAIKAAMDSGYKPVTKRYVFAANFAQDANVPAATLDLTAYQMDWATGSPPTTLYLFLNGRILDGADAINQGDAYPGTTPASGDLKFSFPSGVKTGYVLLSLGFSQT